MIEKLKLLGECIHTGAVLAYKDCAVALNDLARMSEAETNLSKVASGAFLRCFNEVAKRISNARNGKSADIYCELANEAVCPLVNGECEANVLVHFDEMLLR